MVRQARVEYQGAIYHVIQRGNNRENVFESPEKKNFFISLLNKTVAVDGIELYAYVVMGNHYHLAMRTSGETLSKVMHRINTIYSMYYNREMKRTGHVFQGRYKAIPVLDERYLISLVKYIHLNPVRAGICKDLRDYPWSGERCYRTGEPGIIEIGLLLDILSNDRRMSIRKYNQLMEQEDDPVIKEFNITENNNNEGRKRKKPAGGRKPLDEILRQTVLNVEDLELIKRGSRLRRLMPVKIAYARSAVDHGYSLNEIASHIGLSPVAVLKHIYRSEQ